MVANFNRDKMKSFTIFFMTNLIFDFDSTIVRVELLEELASAALNGRPDKERILDQLKEITNKGMKGELAFEDSLTQRLALISLNNSHLEEIKKTIVNQISPSVLANLDFFKNNAQDIYIVSGGFKDLILPVSEILGIDGNHVFANEFILENGAVVGVNKDIPIAFKGGKGKQVAQLNLQPDVWMIGDGFTDYEVKLAGHAHKFIAYTENVSRDNVIATADHIASDMSAIIDLLVK